MTNRPWDRPRPTCKDPATCKWHKPEDGAPPQAPRPERFISGPQDVLIRREGWNPEAIDDTLRALRGAFACVVGCGMPGGPVVFRDCYVVRCLRGAQFAVFAMRRQGYADVVEVIEGLYDQEIA